LYRSNQNFDLLEQFISLTLPVDVPSWKLLRRLWPTDVIVLNYLRMCSG
jgi:hypothetical protein